MNLHKIHNWVISGISGRFPESENVDSFWKHLVEGRNMVSENNRRWNVDGYEIPHQMGNIVFADKFDASFFGVTGTQANAMDPKIRILLEVAYEAIADAGINPISLNGARVGVFIASSSNECGEIWLRSNENPSGHYGIGCIQCMQADRIAYAFNFKGPSCTVDSGCSASFSALQYAMLALKNGLCDSAIVGCANINFSPLTTTTLFNSQALSADGRCKAFDADCDGFVRSEAVVALYICRKDRANRSYGAIAGVKCNNDGYKPEGISVPSAEMQVQVIQSVYSEAGLNPLDVFYVEAHGTGTKVGDPKEIQALSKVFCDGRKEPLLVGSVKSNMGHAETAAGLCGIIKVLLSRRAGFIPPNLHFKTPNPDCQAIIDGTIKVVTKPQPFMGRLVGINSFGMGGTSAHMILEFDEIESLSIVATDCNNELLTDDREEIQLGTGFKHRLIPTIILASGRTAETVEHFLNHAIKNIGNSEYIGLMHNISLDHVPKNRFFGYALTKSSGEHEVTIEAKKESAKSIWYFYTGLGSQWFGMTKEMVKFNTFKNSINLSSEYLTKVGVDLESILETQDTQRLNDLHNACVAITACQIGLTQLLTSLSINPDGIIGQSVGEIACAYADGSLTHEQTIIACSYRTKAFMKSNIPPGTMASVALTWEDAQARCPSDIFPAIHNAQNNVTIGGPKASIRSIVEILTNEGIFAKEVTSAIHAFHTPYVKCCEETMVKMLQEIIPEPKRRSSKWLSSSIPENDWNSILSTLSSAEYFANNAVSPVYLYQVLKHIPQNALLAEIGPHCFLQTILKQTLIDPTVVIGLMHCSHDNALYFLKSLGKIFFAGLSLNIAGLYEPVNYPVSAITPSISSIIKWDHSLSWDVPNYENEISSNRGTKFTINVSNDEFLSGHEVQNMILFPATGYIWLVWKAFAKLQYAKLDDLPISLENFKFARMTELLPNKNVEFDVSILSESGYFEIKEGNEIVCTGTIRKINDKNPEVLTSSITASKTENILIQKDFYKLLRLKGYDYKGLFRGVRNIDYSKGWAELEWNNDWICFLDAMLQTLIIDVGLLVKELNVPMRMKAITIHPTIFRQSLIDGMNTVIVRHCKYLNVVQCQGIKLCGLRTSTFPLRSLPVTPEVQVQMFQPYIDPNQVIVSTEVALELFIGIVVDNSIPVLYEPFIFTEYLDASQPVQPNLKLALCTKFDSCEHRVICSHFIGTFDRKTISPLCHVFEDVASLSSLSKSHVIWINHEDDVNDCIDLIIENGFLILCTPYKEISCKLSVIATRQTENGHIHLLRKPTSVHLKSTIVSLDMCNFEWVEVLKDKLKSQESGIRVHVLSTSSISGIIGFTRCLLRDPDCQNARSVHIPGLVSTQLSMDAIEFKDILQKDLVFNVKHNNTWGSYLYVTFKDFGKPKISKHVQGTIPIIGDLSSLCWVESPCKLYKHEQYEIHFTSLNFKDVLYATGRLPKSAFTDNVQKEECILGLDFSGLYRNKRVFGASWGKCLATALDHKPELVWNVPDKWTLEEAATVPIVYSTVLYAMLIRGGLKRGESILIHSGSGAVGLAAITIALSMNCVVFTTVGTPEKRTFLKNQFSQLNEEQILDSRFGNVFKEEILLQTQGRGVNMVLNSLAQEGLKASLDCIGECGRFMDIGKFDTYANTAIGMEVLLKSVEIHGIHMDSLFQGNYDEKKHLEILMQDYLDQGIIHPLPFTCFGHDELETAFRYMSNRSRVGKVVIKVKDSTGPEGIAAIPRTYLYPHKTYIIIGGLGGMGLELITWMIERGARRLFIISRSGVSTSYQKYLIHNWEKLGAIIFLRHADVSVRSEVHQLMMEAIAVGPLGGVFNVALVLQDGIFSNQSAKTFMSVAQCKFDASVNFDILSRLHAPSMEHFVVFSSIASGRGNAGQTNYGYTNSAMERICEQRKADGFSALAIQWGDVADVGSRENATFDIAGLKGQSISSCIATFDLFLQQNEPVVSSLLLSDGQQFTPFSLKTLSQSVADILGLQDVAKLDLNTTLTEHGMDSLMAAQVKHAIQRKKNITLTASAYGALTFKDLIAMDTEYEVADNTVGVSVIGK